MLVVPVINKSGRKHIPYLTLTLIIINVLVYFLLQGNDNQLYGEAMTFYEESGLLNIELTSYREYLKEGESDPQTGGGENSALLYQMFQDDQFLHLLRINKVITQEQDIFPDWREKRDQFESKKDKVVIQRFGYSPERKNWIGLFTCMFLHGSTMHLVGNMVFLYLLGTLLEVAISPVLLLTGYLFTGVCASWLFGFVSPLSSGPLIGASGAIAGLMGAYTVIFWLRKVTIFYSLGFYFDYAKVSAIVLLPVWLGNEFFQLYTMEGSHVAYMAHIGGLVSGSILGGGHKLFRKDAVNSLYHEEEEKDAITIHLEKGLEKIARLNLKGARREMQAILAIQPDHRPALRHIFNIDKSNPGSDLLHESAASLLASMNKAEDGQFLETYEEYQKASKQPRLSKPTLLRLTRIYLGKKKFQKAEGYLAHLLKGDGEEPSLPLSLMRLAEGYNEAGNKEKARTCLKLLAKRFPRSEEGERARDFLKALVPAGQPVLVDQRE